MSLAQLVSWGSLYYTFSLLMPAMEQDLGLSRVQVSGAFSAALLASGVAGLPVGRWIEQGYGRRVMAGGSLLAGLLLIGHAFISGMIGLYLTWIGLGLAMGAIFYEPVFAITIRRWPTDYRKPIIAMTFLGGLASTAFIPLTAWLLSEMDWRQTCMVLAGLHLLLCLPIHLVMLADEAPGTARKTLQARPEVADAAGPSLHELTRSAAFMLVSGCVIGLSLLSAALSAHMVPLLSERGLPASWAVAVPASIGALQVLGRLVLFVFEGRFDPRSIDRAIPWLLPASLAILLASGGSVIGALVFATCYGVGNGLITIMKATSIAAYVSRERVAVLSGLQSFPVALARSVGPVLTAVLWSVTSSYGLALIVLTAVGVISALMLHSAQRHALRAD
jgi:MFS family permease